MIGRHVTRLTGFAPALPTFFTADGALDAASFEHLCHRQFRGGASALLVGGTTGEAPTLSKDEHRALIDIAVRVTHGRIPVIAGAGSNSTQRAIDLARQAEAAGADAILSVVPYYNRPTQRGLVAHFDAIRRATGLPIVLYDVPRRTGCALNDDTVVELAGMPRIIGLKDATGDAGRPARLRPRVGAEFRLLSGDDATAMGFIAQGGNGCISVTSNVAPGLARELYLGHVTRQSAARQRQLATAFAQLTAALFRETNPAPVKYALSLLVASMSPSVRLPLVPAGPQTQAAIAEALDHLAEYYPRYLVDRPALLDGRQRLAQAI
ncbi:MAG: 4-hydroxy-tetrahydrodipicolinate synthase [Proteobacteria bacterium]|nr:4-hydroxy-tetrahydrodipicolinate synthase [Pseudomonadota bacterium]